MILIVVLATSITAMSSDSSPAYNFLNIPSSTHIYGLGGVNISVVDDDVNLTDQNPALLGPEIDMQIGLNYMSYLGESNFAGIKFAKAATDYSAWSIGVQYFGYGEMQQAEADGAIIGTFSPKDVTFNVAYSHDITDRLRGGINVKTIYSSYEQYTAWALATDLGINYYDPEKDMSLSVVVANLGGQVKRFNERYDRLPIDVRFGWSQFLSAAPVRLSITAWNLTKWKLPYYDAGDGTSTSDPEYKESFSSNLFRHLIFAAELVPNERFYIGLAYNYKTRTDMGTYSRSFVSGFSIGAELKVSNFGIGLALSQPHTGATTFMLNLNANLSDILR